MDWLGERLYEWVGFWAEYPFDALRKIILYQFDSIPEVVRLDGPKFVFMHIISPHPPYLFGPHGEPLETSGKFTLAEGMNEAIPTGGILYRDQAIYITSLVEEALETIVKESDVPPVIILQADHGPEVGLNLNSPYSEEAWQRTAILNAYLVPEKCADDLYPTITPVNSFRLVNRCLFGQDIEMLDDLIFFSFWPRINAYEFVDITGEVQLKTWDATEE